MEEKGDLIQICPGKGNGKTEKRERLALKISVRYSHQPGNDSSHKELEEVGTTVPCNLGRDHSLVHT
jgi:hypothetical protein